MRHLIGAPFHVGETVLLKGEEHVVSNVFRSDIGPSGWMVSCGKGQGVGAGCNRTGAMDSSNFRPDYRALGRSVGEGTLLPFEC